MADHAVWERLGGELRARRVDGLGYAMLTRFCRDRGIGWRTAWNLENAARDSYSETTLLAADAAYGLQPGSCAAFCEGGELVTVPDAGVLDGLSADDQETVRAFIEMLRHRAAQRKHDSPG